MKGGSLGSPVLTFDSTNRLKFFNADLATVATARLTFSNGNPSSSSGGTWAGHFVPRKLVAHSATQITDIASNDEENKAWAACKEALSAFNFEDEEEEKILGKAFGHVQSPYWGEERKKEVPKLEIVIEILDYLKNLGLSDDDLRKLLKKFPEVLGCSLEEELRTNVKILEKDWSIKGKSLRSLLLRNPKVLGYNVDCKGDCMAQCTRCWVRF